jgi:Tfp pilus assembly protein PilF
MAYAMARALGLQAHMQEVSVPVSFDRREGVDFVAGHINLYIQPADAGGLDTRRPSQHGVVIDFEPQVGSPRIGSRLSTDQVRARYFNNLGADHLAQGDAKRAYFFLKSAIQTDGQFSPPYSNLALLYQRHGHAPQAEALLRLATSLPSDDGVAMGALEALLTSQGRIDEAQVYTGLLVARRERNPYHWIGLGLAELRAEHWRAAVKALEHAQALSSGFSELHRYLAVAYARVGEGAKAEAQLAKLASLNPDDSGYSVLSAKVRRLSGL